MQVTRKQVVWGGTLIGVPAFGALLAAVVMAGWSGRASEPGPASPVERKEQVGEEQVLVKTVRPRLDPAFVVSVQQLAMVEPYYQADLRARVAGPVKFVQKDIGDLVTKGTVLVEIDAPDLVQEVDLKKALVQQARAELVEATNDLHTMEAMVQATRTLVEEKRAELGKEMALRDFQKAQFRRIEELTKSRTVTPELADEKRKELQAAEASCKGAEVALERAGFDLRVAEAKVATARADLETKRAHILVTQKDQARAEALADLTKIRAPFAGVVTRREVDQGAFVQNAATAHTEPLISVARTDVVTVVMRVPDNAAPFVTQNTEALIQIDSLPGRLITGRVTRFSPSVRDKDRTMRVEVDLYNGTQQEYDRYVMGGITSCLTPLAGTAPVESAIFGVASQDAWGLNTKGSADPFPLLAQNLGKEGSEQRLLPGMSGYMRLLLKKFPNAYVVPTSVIFNVGGKAYIEVVRDGTAHRVPVRVQTSDGKLAKIAVIVNEASPQMGVQEMLQDLTGNEEIIISHQTELAEGQAVQPVREDK